MVCAAVAHLPTAVSLLLLEALFMLISGVSLALTWPHWLCLLRVLLCRSLCYRLFPFQALGEVTLHPLSQASMFVYSSRGKWVFPPLLWSFPPSATLTSFPPPGCWACAPTPARGSLARPSLFIYSPGKDSLPSLFGAQCAPPSFPRIFIVLIAYYSVSLFAPGGSRSVQGAMLLWPMVVCGNTTVPLKLTWPASSQAIWVPATGGPGGPPCFSI
jgi:hypothetical protein